MNIEIVAGMGVGKTTLAKLVEKEGFELVDEEFFEVNPFLKEFFNNKKIAFETQSTFLIQMYSQRKKLKAGNHVFDHSYIGNKAFAVTTIENKKEYTAYEKLYRNVLELSPRVNKMIHLVCDEQEQLARINGRGRGFENSIDIEFLRKLNYEIQKSVEEARFYGLTQVVTLDVTHLDLVRNEDDQKTALEKILI